jgi:hypothetical protein
MRFDELPPFLRIEQVQQLTQLSRSQVYALVGRYRQTGGKEGMPVVEFGRNLRVPTAALMRMALIDPDLGAGDDHAA